jgi:hypothetical protein
MARGQLKEYLCSIPERFLRSLTGLGGGAAREVSKVLLLARISYTEAQFLDASLD